MPVNKHDNDNSNDNEGANTEQETGRETQNESRNANELLQQHDDDTQMQMLLKLLTKSTIAQQEQTHFLHASKLSGKIDIKPTMFEGGWKVETWTTSVERAFVGRNIVMDDKKILYAASFLKGAALQFYEYRVKKRGDYTYWGEMKREIEANFVNKQQGSIVRNQLDTVEQKGTMQSYVEKFKLLAQQVDMSDEEQVHRFVKGLSTKTREQIRYLQPRTLDEAVDQAMAHYHSMDAHCSMGGVQTGITEANFVNKSYGRGKQGGYGRGRTQQQQGYQQRQQGGKPQERGRSRSRSRSPWKGRSGTPPRGSRTPSPYRGRREQTGGYRGRSPGRREDTGMHCQRCGRDSHNTKDCYARDGNDNYRRNSNSGNNNKPNWQPRYPQKKQQQQRRYNDNDDMDLNATHDREYEEEEEDNKKSYPKND